MNDRRATQGTQASAVSLQDDDFINSNDTDDKPLKDVYVEDLDSSSSQNTKLL